MTRTLLTAALATATFVALGGGLLLSQTARTAADWPGYGATNAGSKYSPLDQINKDTVKGLRIAWRQYALPPPVQKAWPGAKAGRAFSADERSQRNVAAAMEWPLSLRGWGPLRIGASIEEVRVGLGDSAATLTPNVVNQDYDVARSLVLRSPIRCG